MRVSVGPVTVVAAVLGLVLAGCGGTSPTAHPSPTAATSPTDDLALAAKPWLLRFNAEGGTEGELTKAVYVRYTPSTGATTVHALPGLNAPDTSSGSQALLVSSDQRFALLDAAFTPGDRRRGRLRLYSLADGPNRVVDLRALTGVADLTPVGAVFDPAGAELVTMVDSARRVWKLDLVAGRATADGRLPSRKGWIFANGFDKNSARPYIESVDSDETLPPGNGMGDVRPVKRRGGVIWIDDGTEKSGQPALPCGFAGGFTTAEGTFWLFCADTPEIAAYRLTPGSQRWVPVGKPSAPIVPATAGELPVVLPPTD